MDNRKIWLLTAKNVGVTPWYKKKKTQSTKIKIKPRKAIITVNRNIDIVVSN